MVPATPARYQAGSLLLLALPIPFFLHMLSMVKRKYKYSKKLSFEYTRHAAPYYLDTSVSDTDNTGKILCILH